MPCHDLQLRLCVAKCDLAALRVIRALQVARAAEQRYNEIVKDTIPGANPSWGVNRLRKELYDNGFYFERPTDSSGYLYRNPETGAQVRIMERPSYHWRSDPPEKYYFQYYYRYRAGSGHWGSHVPIPDKE